MPQASSDLRAEWGVDDKSAIEFLESRGYRLLPGWVWQLPAADHQPDGKEQRAVQFLIDEWDFGGIASAKAAKGEGRGMNPLTEKLRPYVEQIKAAAAAGDNKAKEIITLYRMHCDCPSDPGAFALCKAVFDEWIKVRAEG